MTSYSGEIVAMKALVLGHVSNLVNELLNSMPGGRWDISSTQDSPELVKNLQDNDCNLVIIEGAGLSLPPDVAVGQVRLIDETIPIIVLGVGDVEVRVRCLTEGADEVFPKDVIAKELQARIMVRMKVPSRWTLHRELQVGQVLLDVQRRTARVGQEYLTLTPQEFSLLHILAQNAGDACSIALIMRHLSPNTTVRDPTLVRVNVCRLRQKLSAVHSGLAIFSVRKQGYRLVAEQKEEAAA
ncbi:Two-component response regulator [Granulibacter bethesdensis]|uniref:Two-component response regulator n=2 Tax=Granulibacter bethesdensis TaxID=364410 RepID=Q0BQ53_GRABC|nr:winged helix-turn-helix domain-containing protein [Granulibacter bethesdensis]ABI63049.1 Two-component response regulator [Granulibacter bethesdensis CGDNIH1]AHJ67985.1 Two-component response regulator [Granulibacter bethesdensis]APH52922.1 Two-component response regulator [Granulibacter bethesdensis]APH60493.1 Two-component response regulator [Granulibacter bethesdensis]APH65610.1 Two-component response regulator [Granulibacter bethesdensis]